MIDKPYQDPFFQLNPEQEKYQEAIRWLFWGPRRAGRTTAIAYAAIQEALRRPGHSIAILNHSRWGDPTDPASELRTAIHRVAEWTGLTSQLAVNVADSTIRLTITKGPNA